MLYFIIFYWTILNNYHFNFLNKVGGTPVPKSTAPYTVIPTTVYQSTDSAQSTSSTPTTSSVSTSEFHYPNDDSTSDSPSSTYQSSRLYTSLHSSLVTSPNPPTVTVLSTQTSITNSYPQSSTISTEFTPPQSSIVSATGNTVSPAVTSNALITNINHLLNTINLTNSLFFSNGSLDWNLVKDLFSTYTNDLTGCLVNCSNHGLCSVNSQNQLVCACFGNFIGSSCQTDTRPCSANPCLNNGTCVEAYDSSSKEYSYTCNCGEFHFGERCEFQVDLCVNKTCAGNGRCYVNASFVPVCECYKMFLGDNCEEQSEKLKTVKQMISATSVIAIVTICVTYLIVILCDLHTLLTKKQKRRKINPKIIHYQYKP